MKNFSIVKRISIGTLAMVLAVTAAFAPLSFVQPYIAEAQLGGPAFETNPLVITGITATAAATAATAVNTTLQTTGTAPKNILDALAWTVAKMTVQSLTRSTVNWINSGFKGSPAFVSDLQSNLKYLGDTIADDFLNHLNQTVVDTTGFNIKSPFQDQLTQKLREEYYQTTSSWGLNYTLGQTTKDPKAFLDGDFSKGGVSAFLSASQNPANNPFGAYRLASNQLWAQVDAAGQQRKAELGWGKGFLPWRGGCNTPAAATPANAPSASGNKTDSKNAASSAGKTVAGNKAEAPLSLSRAEQCPFNAVRTPGSIIEGQLEGVLGSGVRQLELADSINEIVGALIGQLVNQVLGAGGLLGSSQPSAGGGQSYINSATSPSQYSGITSSLANGVIQNITNDNTNFITYRSNWQKVLDAANAAEKSCGVRDDITAVKTQATAGVAKGNKGITANAAILSEVQAATQSTAADANVQITTALADYQSYLSSPNVPNTADESEAALESQDTASSTSLYTKMVSTAKTCGVTSGTTSL